MNKPKVVVLGGGFAGLQFVKKLNKSLFDITIIDQYNFHQFQPLFYQVATARLEPSSISFPLRKVFQNQDSVHVRLALVESIDTSKKVVHTNSGQFVYDYLVIATGCRSNFFGNENIEKHAFPMKSTTDAIALRNRILLNFEAALRSDADKSGIMNIVIAGGGPTGVELAGALIEMKKHVLPKDYPDMDFSSLNIYLIEGSGAILSAMSSVSQKKAEAYLTEMGVIVMTNALIEDYDGIVVSIKGGTKIHSRNLIWTAGVTGNVPIGIDTNVLARGNRITVDSYNRINGLEDVFAIGDIAYMPSEEWKNGHPQLANVANNQAKNLAVNIKNLLNQKPLKPFIYKNPGTMATVGKRKAVVDLPSFSFQGLFAWLFWMFLHLMLILSVKNKLVIFINWAISYMTNDTTLRLILLPTRKQIEIAAESNNE